jgi:hypothetical protein
MKRLFSPSWRWFCLPARRLRQTLTNGNFESPTAGTFDYTNSGWSRLMTHPSASRGPPIRACVPATSRVGTGTRPAACTRTSAATNGTYTFSMWMRLELGVSNQQMNLRLEWYDANTNALQLEDVEGSSSTCRRTSSGTRCMSPVPARIINLAFVRAVLYADWGPDHVAGRQGHHV